MGRDVAAYEAAAAAIRAEPNGQEARTLRRWIVWWHIKHGGMPPLDLRPDWRKHT